MQWLKCSPAQQDHTAVFKDTDNIFEFNSVVYGGNTETFKIGCFQEIPSDFSIHTGSVHTLPRANSDPTLRACPQPGRLQDSIQENSMLPRCTGWPVSLSICEDSKLGKSKKCTVPQSTHILSHCCYWSNTLFHKLDCFLNLVFKETSGGNVLPLYLSLLHLKKYLA